MSKTLFWWADRSLWSWLRGRPLVTSFIFILSALLLLYPAFLLIPLLDFPPPEEKRWRDMVLRKERPPLVLQGKLTSSLDEIS